MQEAYLIQTRLQKMPYKHIAAHLNKTELACRLHYHQISNGSNRRKRNLSCSSVATDYSHLLRERTPGMENRLSPIPQMEATNAGVTVSPGGSSVRLPSIMSATTSPKLPAILPKPDAVEGLKMYPDGQRALPSGPFPGYAAQKQPLKLDTALPSVSAPSHNSAHVDLARLQAIYAGHRNTFWAAIATEYGHNASPATLERAWKTERCCSSNGPQHHSPITPSASPVSETKEVFGEYRMRDRTSISSLLGPEAAVEGRTMWDRDMIRKMEVDRV